MGTGAVVGGLAVFVIAAIIDIRYIGPWLYAAAAGMGTQFWNPSFLFVYFTMFPFAISVVILVLFIGAILGGGRR